MGKQNTETRLQPAYLKLPTIFFFPFCFPQSYTLLQYHSTFFFFYRKIKIMIGTVFNQRFPSFSRTIKHKQTNSNASFLQHSDFFKTDRIIIRYQVLLNTYLYNPRTYRNKEKKNEAYVRKRRKNKRYLRN